MIKIHFEGTNWSELRAQIQEFAVAHLNAKFGDMKLDQGKVAEVGGHSDVVIPEKEPAAKKPRGGAAPKPTHVGVDTGPESKTVVNEVAPSSPSHTLEECTAALQKVWDKHGMETSLECLTRFGAKRARELAPETYANFIALCEEKSK